MPATLLSGKNAAILADAAYSVKDAANNGEALEMAREDTRFTQNSQTGQSLSVPVEIKGATVGRSGLGTRVSKVSGFGVLLKRDVGIEGEYILTIRGTQTGYDWLSNINIGMTRGPSGSLAHAGFVALYESMRANVMGMIESEAPQRMHFVGHSLGGALATLAAMDYANSYGKPTFLYTFGAPRVGGGALNSDLGRLLGHGHSKRVYNQADPVPLIPLYPFLHSGPGTTCLPDNFGRVTLGAHSMQNFYIPQMPTQGWPQEISPASWGGPDYWLRQAEQAPGYMSKMGFYALGMALNAMMPTIRLVTGLAIDGGLWLADKLAVAMASAARMAKSLGDNIIRFISAALRFCGLGRFRRLTVADMTEAFLRWVFDMILRPVLREAAAAVSRLF